MILPAQAAVPICKADEHRPHRMAEVIPGGPRKACHRNGQICFQHSFDALCHLPGHRSADRPQGVQIFLAYAQDVMLDPVGVADDPALENSGAAGNAGQLSADPAAGQTFRRGKPPPIQAMDHLTGLLHHGISPGSFQQIPAPAE